MKQLSQTGTARSAAAAFFWRGGMGDFTKGKRLFAGVRKISSEIQKSSCIVHRCTVYDLIAKKEAGYRRNVGRSRSGDISCRKKDVSCRRSRKARKICYTEHRKLKNCPGAPPDSFSVFGVQCSIFSAPCVTVCMKRPFFDTKCHRSGSGQHSFCIRPLFSR